jgi:hypothetical protein
MVVLLMPLKLGYLLLVDLAEPSSLEKAKTTSCSLEQIGTGESRTRVFLLPGPSSSSLCLIYTGYPKPLELNENGEGLLIKFEYSVIYCPVLKILTN